MLRVKDVASYSKTADESIRKSFKRLKELFQEYIPCDDLNTLDRIKREYSAELISVAEHYGEVKKFKGRNHTFMEDQQKLLKAQTIDLVMVERKMSANMAKEVCYTHSHYTERLALIEKLKKEFIIIEEIYERHCVNLQMITQTISTLSKLIQANLD